MIASQLPPFVTPSSAAAGLFAIPALAVALHRLSIEEAKRTSPTV
jgi:hypothetical protein